MKVTALSVSKLPSFGITKNAWCTPLNLSVISNIDYNILIEYRLQYSFIFIFLNYHQNRLFLYFLVNYRLLSIISLLFGVLIPNPG